ncbi:MAG: LysM domain, partial [Bacteroidota bacterium]
MKKAYYILILFLASILNYAQTKHTVIKGETLYSISKKYNITSEDILK